MLRSFRVDRMNTGALHRPLLAAAALALAGSALAAEPLQVDMSAERWEANGNVTFLQQSGYPHGLLSVKGGGALLKDVTFDSGTIEYDIKEDADAQGFAGLWFRQRGTESAENFYLRTESDCPRSIECMQYAPVSHGNMQWDAYPEYQAAGPVHASGWNHVKLVISGRRMNAFVNGETTPSLVVGSLEGDAASGRIQLRGDATFANFAITPGATEGLSPEPATDPTAGDARFVRHWQLSPAATLARGKETSFAALPAPDAAWEPLDAERKGYVNISRQHGTARGEPDLIWLKTTLTSDRAQVKRVDLGWAREIWVFIDGRPVFADRNLYYPASGRKPPLGRLALQNGAFDLPLRAGANEVEIAISNDLTGHGHYGWGFEFRLVDVDGLTLPVARPAM